MRPQKFVGKIENEKIDPRSEGGVVTLNWVRKNPGIFPAVCFGGSISVGKKDVCAVSFRVLRNC